MNDRKNKNMVRHQGQHQKPPCYISNTKGYHPLIYQNTPDMVYLSKDKTILIKL